MLRMPSYSRPRNYGAVSKTDYRELSHRGSLITSAVVSDVADEVLNLHPRDAAWEIANLRLLCGTYGQHIECDLNTRDGQLLARLMHKLPKLPSRQVSAIDLYLAEFTSTLG